MYLFGVLVSCAEEDPLLGGGHLSACGGIALGLETYGDQVEIKAELAHVLILPDALVLVLGW
jgi:hypothetical protein